MHSALLLAFAPYKATIYSQEVIGPYIADFLITPSNIILEVDGGIHLRRAQMAHDRSRDTYLSNRGFRVLRVTNIQVGRSSRRIAQRILKHSLPLEMKTNPIRITICKPGRSEHLISSSARRAGRKWL